MALKKESNTKGANFFSLPSSFVLFCFCCSVSKVKSNNLCFVSPCCFVLQVMLSSLKEKGGDKIRAYMSRARLDLGVVKMRVEQGKM